MAGEKKPAKRGQGREEQIFIFGISWCGAVFVLSECILSRRA
ncbi:hypothetical protein FB99_25530 [Pantoea agglomerans]|nr:hypothetical protein FB99_25530 [Pantoea agglomerans]